jgi:hypothetical protein
MKSTYTRISMAVALLAVAPFSQAGFFFEKAADPAPAPVQAPAKVRPVDGRIPVTSTTPGARNVNPSAPAERIAKMNRQRIDLESRVSSRITQSGNSPLELQSLRGLGRGVTFEDALRQVLPVGWTVYSDQEAPLEKLVDWQGGRTWPMVMHALLTTLDMRAHIDWDAQELMLFVPAPMVAAEKPAEIIAQADATAAPAPAAPAAAASAAAPILNPVKAPSVDVKDVVWTVKPGNLRENLRVLAAQAGWTLVWNATIGDMTVNYDVEAPGYQFTGPLIGSEGVLAKVIDLYAQAEHPLAVTFYHGNKVVEVRLHEVPDMKPTPSAKVMTPPREPVPVAAAPAPIRQSNDSKDQAAGG